MGLIERQYILFFAVHKSRVGSLFFLSNPWPMNYDGTEAASLQGARCNRDPQTPLSFSEKTQKGAGRGWHSGPRPAYLRPSSALRPPGRARETIPLLNGGGLGWPADVVFAYWTEGAMTSPLEKRPGRGGRTNLICLSS